MTIKEVTYLEYSPLGNASNTADTFVPYLKILKLKVTTRISSFLHSWHTLEGSLDSLSICPKFHVLLSK